LNQVPEKSTGTHTIQTERWGKLLVETFRYRVVITTESNFHAQINFDPLTSAITPTGALFDDETWKLIQRVVSSGVKP